jgi:hypothetical protein
MTIIVKKFYVLISRRSSSLEKKKKIKILNQKTIQILSELDLVAKVISLVINFDLS